MYLYTLAVAMGAVLAKQPSLNLTTGDYVALIELGRTGEASHALLAWQAVGRLGGGSGGIADRSSARGQQAIPQEWRRKRTGRIHSGKCKVEL